MPEIFLIPGMGADTRIFNNIEISENYDVVPIDWIPHHITDTLDTYAQKLIYHYHINNSSIVIGNSLGGMLAVEIAKKITPKKTILISSIKTINEAPVYFKFFRRAPIYRYIPDSFLRGAGLLIKPIFGKLSEADLWLFNDMLHKTSPDFLRWAAGAVLKWDNQTIPANVYHIHGDKDQVLPVKFVKNATIVSGGTHLMIFDKAKPINKWLKTILKK